jgi:hypothetical protein
MIFCRLNRELCGISLRFDDNDDDKDVDASSSTSSSQSYVARITPLPERLRSLGNDPRLMCEALNDTSDGHSDLIRCIADVYRM